MSGTGALLHCERDAPASNTPQSTGRAGIKLSRNDVVQLSNQLSIMVETGVTLTEAALGYFQQSEQIPTRLRLAAGALAQRGARPEAWRAGAIMVQHLPRDGGISPLPVHSGDLALRRLLSNRSNKLPVNVK